MSAPAASASTADEKKRSEAGDTPSEAASQATDKFNWNEFLDKYDEVIVYALGAINGLIFLVVMIYTKLF